MLLTPIGNPEPRDFTPLDTPIIFSQMVPTLKKLRFTMSDLFSKMPQHTTFIFAEALQKSQPVPCVPSKNSVFANTENFLVTLLRQKNNSGLFVDSTWSAISKIFFKKFQ